MGLFTGAYGVLLAEQVARRARQRTQDIQEAQMTNRKDSPAKAALRAKARKIDIVDPKKLVGGYKADEDKVRMDLIPPEAIFALADILTSGAKKYSNRNWEKGMKWSRPFAASMRHLWAWWAGAAPTTKSFLFGSLDSESGRSHLWHALCCISFLVAYEERELVAFDDRFDGTVRDE